MALQNVKHVAWLAYQLELKETQQHRDNEVNHVSREQLWAMCQPVAYVSHHRPYSPIPSQSSSPEPLPVERTMTRAARRGSRTERRTPARSYRLDRSRNRSAHGTSSSFIDSSIIAHQANLHAVSSLQYSL